MGNRKVARVVLASAAYTTAIVAGLLLLLACSTTHTIVSPECPPLDSLRYVRFPLGCNIPQDSTP